MYNFATIAIRTNNMSGGNARESLNNSIKLLRQSMSMMG